MSLDHLPANIDLGVQRFADELHISHDEALIQLIQAGLDAPRTAAPPINEKGKRPGELLIGMFSSPEDRAIFDEAMTYSRELRQTERLRNVWQ